MCFLGLFGRDLVCLFEFKRKSLQALRKRSWCWHRSIEFQVLIIISLCRDKTPCSKKVEAHANSAARLVKPHFFSGTSIQSLFAVFSSLQSQRTVAHCTVDYQRRNARSLEPDHSVWELVSGQEYSVCWRCVTLGNHILLILLFLNWNATKAGRIRQWFKGNLANWP